LENQAQDDETQTERSGYSMSFTEEQKQQLNKLLDHRDNIADSLFHIERIIKVYFPAEFDIAYQHWIPQITTALYEDKRWLSRGEQTMQNTLNRLFDKDNKQIGQNIRKIL
jgi:flagellar biosynthesis chaperone FliJ